jgi:ELWxxDGT repeat protein
MVPAGPPLPAYAVSNRSRARIRPRLRGSRIDPKNEGSPEATTISLWTREGAMNAMQRLIPWLAAILLATLSEPVIAETATDPAYLVKDIDSTGGSGPHLFTHVGNTLFFVAGDDAHGVELWKTDGTQAGTVLVKDVRPGPRTSYPGRLTAVGNLLFFRAETQRHGYELWKSDGTADGTTLVKDIHPGSRSSMTGSLAPFGQTAALGDTLIFRASDGAAGYELWRSDGTEAGTTLVKDIWSGRHGSFPTHLTALGNEVFFDAVDSEQSGGLWKTDGTEQGTVVVGEGLFATQLTPVGGRLYFAGSDGVHGLEPWLTDGTVAGTKLVLDINPGKDSSVDSPPSGPWAALGDRLLFPADDGQHGMELWTSDGTAGGTAIIADLHPGARHSDPEEVTVADETLAYFFAWGGKGVWRTDGTEQGTVQLGRIGGTSIYNGSNWRTFFAAGTTLFYESAKRAFGYELWRSDGTVEGTGLAADICPGPNASEPRSLNAIGTTLLFAANDCAHGRELWAFPAATP